MAWLFIRKLAKMLRSMFGELITYKHRTFYGAQPKKMLI